MKLALAIILVLISLQSVKPQELIKLRSTLGNGGTSETLFLQGRIYIVQQSIGQPGIIGSRQVGGYYVLQGFIQPPGFGTSNHQEIMISRLKATVYPNPFKNLLTITIEEETDDYIGLLVTNITGKLVYSNKYYNTSELRINFGHLPPGPYIVKVSKGFKHFSAILYKD